MNDPVINNKRFPKSQVIASEEFRAGKIKYRIFLSVLKINYRPFFRTSKKEESYG